MLGAFSRGRCVRRGSWGDYLSTSGYARTIDYVTIPSAITDAISAGETASRWAEDPIGSALSLASAEGAKIGGIPLNEALRLPGAILREIEDLYRGPDSPQATVVGNSHAYVISAGWGDATMGSVVPLGFVTQVAETGSMNVIDEFCVGPRSNGLPSALIPSVMNARELQLTGVELSRLALYYALGTVDLTVLSKAAIPLRLSLAQRVGGRLSVHARTYAGCMLSGYNRTLTAEGDRIVRTSLSLRWLSTTRG